MTEPKYVYRLIPCPAYDISGMESWLEDMAAKGLHLAPDGFFLGYATFEVGPPQREKFRLEATATNGGLFSEEYNPDDDAVEMNRHMGWNYRARRGQFHIYSASDPDAPELNTDPQVQAITIGALGKYLRKSLFHTLFLMVLYALTYFGDLIVSAAVCFGTWKVGLVILLLIWDLVRDIRRIMTLSKLRKQLLSGEPLPHRSDYARHGYRHFAGNVVRAVLWVFVIGSFLVFAGKTVTDEDAVKLDDYPEPFPFATLADLYPGAKVDRMDGILESQVTVWSDVLAPENYDFSEYAEVTLNGEDFDCYLTVNYHRTRWDWTAAMLAREFVSQSGANFWEQTLAKLFGQEPVIDAELSIPGADYAAYYSKYHNEPYLVVQRDNIVLRIQLDVLGNGPGIEPEALARMVLEQIR